MRDELKTPQANGTTQVIFEPVDFMDMTRQSFCRFG